MTGHFLVVCAPGANGRSYFSQQNVAAPFHLSKPYSDAGVLVANIVSVTPGVLESDALRISAEVRPGASLALVAPSATRLHRMRDGSARLEQSFHVAAGGFLEVHPETLIPGAGCRFSQDTVCEVEGGGSVLLFEVVAPGRVASGESFLFDRLAWTTRIRYARQRVVMERAELTRDPDRLVPLKALGGYYGCVYSLGPGWEALQTFAGPECAGVTGASCRLAVGGWAHKALAEDSVALRRWKTALREALYRAIGREPPEMRR